MSGRVAIVGAAAVSAFGLEWRGLAAALDRGARPAPSRELEASHPGTLAREVPPIAAADDAGDARQRKLMARPARLAAIATRRALRDAGWAAGAEVGFYLGVGASAPSMSEVTALLQASIDVRGFSLERCGQEGLLACNPLFTFQLLNNFTLCHAAILEGITGPNAAFFSRGTGTVTALAEAAHAVAAGDCDRALAGGADSALHPLTLAELRRDGALAAGLLPGEGAALVALAGAADRPGEAPPIAWLEGSAVRRARGRPLAPAASAAAEAALRGPADAVVIAGWGGPARAALRQVAAERSPGAAVIDAALGFGEALAAGPALAWALALDRIAAGAARRALVLSAGTDGDAAAVALAAPSGEAA